MAYIATGMMARKRAQREANKSIDSQEAALRAKRKPYTASKWSREMTNQIKKDTDSKGNYKPSGCFLDQLHKKGGNKVPEHAKADLRAKGHRV